MKSSVETNNEYEQWKLSQLKQLNIEVNEALGEDIRDIIKIAKRNKDFETRVHPQFSTETPMMSMVNRLRQMLELEVKGEDDLNYAGILFVITGSLNDYSGTESEYVNLHTAMGNPSEINHNIDIAIKIGSALKLQLREPIARIKDFAKLDSIRTKQTSLATFNDFFPSSKVVAESSSNCKPNVQQEASVVADPHSIGVISEPDVLFNPASQEADTEEPLPQIKEFEWNWAFVWQCMSSPAAINAYGAILIAVSLIILASAATAVGAIPAVLGVALGAACFFNAGSNRPKPQEGEVGVLALK